MKQWLLALALVVGLPGWGWAADWYVTNAGAGATDGSNYANAFAGWSDINFGGISAGDTLIVCGTVSSNTSMAVSIAGTAANPITITGNCPEEGGVTGVLSGNNTATGYVFGLSIAADSSYVNVEDLTIKNSAQDGTADCLFLSSFGSGAGHNTLSRLTITHCGQEGIITQKPYTTIQDSTIDDIGEDGINFNTLAINGLVTGNTIGHFSTINTTGDGIESSTTMSGNLTIRNNVITFDTLTSTKQAIICGNTAGTGICTVEYNTITAPVAANNGGISVITGTSVVRGNIVTGFTSCISSASSASGLIVYVYGNVVKNCSLNGIRFTASTGTHQYFVYHNTGYNVHNGLTTSMTGGATSTLAHYNNIYKPTSTSTGQVLGIVSGVTYSGNGNFLGSNNYDQYIGNISCGGSTYFTVAAYQAACVQESASSAADPLFLSTTDYRLSAASTARRAGISGYLCKDVRGRACYPDTPDIGAYQATSGDQAATRTAR